ncbi:hypothetical protein V3C99_000497 [Haemonchus contortus]
MVGCKDVDECASGLHKCDETARCHNYVGGYACFCPMGYRKMDKGICVDIDECTESQGGCCSGNATCINKEGSYGCKCNEGFVGDGYKCMPVEKRGCTEAEWADANCGKNHMCTVDSKGKKDCDMCKMGFEMKNGECVDINECASPGLNMCDKNAVCNNLMGTYACQCKKGFRGDGYMCDDEDECRTMPCHPQAECHNVPGSFQCKCPEGFEGDGVKTCVNPLENSCKDMERLCGRTEHTACLSVRLFDGSLGSICECEPNYRYNNVSHQCEDIDECAENRHNCDPASSTCVNEDGGFRCECYEGYEGTGGVCVDIDECERGVAGCHSMAMCINQPGSCGCKCVHGFTGDGTQCNAMKRETDNTCTQEWQRLCKKENRTCHVDDEDVPQCGSCIEGHQLVNGTCHQIESGGVCSDPTKNNCDVNAECIDVRPGRHFCTCKVGYIGDGMRCDDIDECSLAGICDTHATCHNSPGSFNCTCNPGYIGNGHVCEAIDTTNGTKTTPRPNCHLDARLCHANAECMADGNCKCRHGYEGDGIQNCTEITTTTTAFTSTTLSTLSISSVPRSTGAITEIDENETSTVEPSSSTFPLTTDHHRNHTTITDSIRSSTIIHTTPPIHESSTKPSETDSSSASTVSGIEITKSSFVTTSNLPSDGAKQKTTTVDTNQPHETHELTSEESFITELGSVEVTQAMIVLPKTSPKPSQVFNVPDDSTESPKLTDEDVLLSRVFQRESTTSHTPAPSSGSSPLFTLSSDSSSNTEVSESIESTTNAFIARSIETSSSVESTTDEGLTEAGGVETGSEETVTLTSSLATSEHSPFPTPKGLSSEEVTGPSHRATSSIPPHTSHPLTEEGSGEAQLATIESHTSETTTPSDDNVSLSLSSTEATLSQKTSTSKAPVTSEEPFTEEQTSTRGKYTEENLLSSSETPVVASAEFTEEASETSTVPVEIFLASTTRQEATFTSTTESLSTQTTELPPFSSKFGNATTEPVLVSSGTPDFTGERTSELSTLEVETSAAFTTTPSTQSSKELSIHSSTTPKSEEDSGLTTATATPSGESGKISSTRAVEETHSFEGEETSQATTVSPFDVSTPEKSDAGLLNRFTSSTKAFARESTPKSDNTTDEPLLTSSETSKAVSSEFTETTQEISTFEVETSVATKRGFRVNATSTDHLIKSSTTPIPKELLELTNGTEVTPSSNGSGISPTSKESSETLERKGNVSRPPLKSIEVTTIPTATEPTRLTGIPQEPLVEGLTSPKVTLIIHETTEEGLGSTESGTTSSGLKTTAEPGSFVEENVTTPEGPRPSTDRSGTTRIPLISSENVSATSPSNTTSEEVGQHSTEYTTTPSSAFSSPTSTDNDSFKSTAISESTPGASDTEATSTSAPPNVTQQKEEPRTTSESTTGEGFQTTITSKPESGTTSSEKVEGTSTTVSERTDESVTDDQSKTTVEMPSTVINPEVTTAAPGDLSSNTVKSTSTLISTTTYETVSQQQSTTIVDESATTDTTSTSQATTSGTSSTAPVETPGTTSSKPSFEFQTTGGERSTTSAPSDATSPTVSTRKDTTGDLTSSPTGPTQPIVTVTPKEDHTNTTINVTTTTAPSSPKSSTASTTVSSTSKPGEEKNPNSNSSTAQSTSSTTPSTTSTAQSTSSTAVGATSPHKIMESTGSPTFSNTVPPSEKSMSTQVPRVFDREGATGETDSFEEVSTALPEESTAISTRNQLNVTSSTTSSTRAVVLNFVTPDDDIEDTSSPLPELTSKASVLPVESTSIPAAFTEMSAGTTERPPTEANQFTARSSGSTQSSGATTSTTSADSVEASSTLSSGTSSSLVEETSGPGRSTPEKMRSTIASSASPDEQKTSTTEEIEIDGHIRVNRPTTIIPQHTGTASTTKPTTSPLNKTEPTEPSRLGAGSTALPTTTTDMLEPTSLRGSTIFASTHSRLTSPGDLAGGKETTTPEQNGKVSSDTTGAARPSTPTVDLFSSTSATLFETSSRLPARISTKMFRPPIHRVSGEVRVEMDTGENGMSPATVVDTTTTSASGTSLTTKSREDPFELTTSVKPGLVTSVSPSEVTRPSKEEKSPSQTQPTTTVSHSEFTETDSIAGVTGPGRESSTNFRSTLPGEQPSITTVSPSEASKPTALPDVGQTEFPGTTAESLSETKRPVEDGDMTSKSTFPDNEESVTSSSPSKATEPVGGSDFSSKLPQSNALTSVLPPQVTDPDEGDDVTSMVTASSIQRRTTPDLSSEDTERRESTALTTGPVPPEEGELTTLSPSGNFTKPSISTSTPNAQTSINRLPQSQSTRPNEPEGSTSKPMMPDIQLTETPETSEPPLQPTRPGEVETSRSPSTSLTSASTRLETSAPPSEVTGITRINNEIDASSKSTPNAQQHATTESPSEPPVQFTGPGNEVEKSAKPSTFTSSPGISTEVSKPGQGNITAEPSDNQHTSTLLPSSQTPSETIEPKPSLSTPTAPQVVITGSPSEPPVQFTGPGDEFDTFSTSSGALPLATQPFETSPEVGVHGRGDTTFRPTISEEHSTKALEPSSETPNKVTQSVQQPSTTGIVSEPPIQSTEPGQNVKHTPSPVPLGQSTTSESLPKTSPESTDSKENVSVTMFPTQPDIKESSTSLWPGRTTTPTGGETTLDVKEGSTHGLSSEVTGSPQGVDVTSFPTPPKLMEQTTIGLPSSNKKGDSTSTPSPNTVSDTSEAPIQFTGPGEGVEGTRRPEEGQHSTMAKSFVPTSTEVNETGKSDLTTKLAMPDNRPTSTPSPSPETSNRFTGLDEQVGVTTKATSSSRQPAVTDSPPEQPVQLTGFGDETGVTPNPSTPTTAASTRSSSKTAGPTDEPGVTSRRTASPPVVIDEIMKPDHVHPGDESVPKTSTKPPTPGSASSPHEGSTTTLKPDTRETQKSSTPQPPPHPGDGDNLTPIPDIEKTEMPNVGGTTSTPGKELGITPRPNIPARQPLTPEQPIGSTSGADSPRETPRFTSEPESSQWPSSSDPFFMTTREVIEPQTLNPTIGPETQYTQEPSTPESSTRPNDKEKSPGLGQPETKRPGSSDLTTTSPRPNLDLSTSSEAPNKVTEPNKTSDLTSKPIPQGTRNPSLPKGTLEPNDETGSTLAPGHLSTDMSDSPSKQGGTVTTTSQPSNPDTPLTSPKPLLELSSTSGSPSEVTRPHGKLGLTTESTTTHETSRVTNRSSVKAESSLSTHEPDVPDVEPGKVTPAIGQPTKTSKQNESFKVTVAHTVGPMTKVDGEMNPEQPHPSATPPTNPTVMDIGSTTPSDFTEPHGKLDLTLGPHSTVTHRTSSPPSELDEITVTSLTTSRPDVPDVQQPDSVTPSVGQPTKTTKQNENFKITVAPTVGPMTKIDGDMNPEQPHPSVATTRNPTVMPTRSTTSTPSDVTEPQGRLDLTSRSDTTTAHETSRAPTRSSVKTGTLPTTIGPDVSDVQKPGVVTTPVGQTTRTTKQNENTHVTEPTIVPMIKVDGEMDPEQPRPGNASSSRAMDLPTKSTTRPGQSSSPPFREQDRQNTTTTIMDVLSTTPATFTTKDPTVTQKERSSPSKSVTTNTTPPLPNPSAATSPISFTLHTTHPVISSTAPSTAPSRPITDAPTSSIAPPKSYFTEPDIFIDSELHSTTEDDLKVVVESFESTAAPTGDIQVTNRRCSSIDRSMCHELAICEVATGSCRCKDGFAGDGYTNCTKFVRPDCVSDPTVCHGNASCDHHTRQCSCNLGHIGDGFVCNPDPQDCVLRKDLCSPEALCIGRRCRCVEGFTGDGIKCVSLYQRSVNCSECDANAHCNDGMCQCNVGYFGNGLCCVPDPRDCVHFSGVCHPDATCDRDERVCKCNTGFLGDGISCFPVRSCRSDPNVCDVEAICLPSGQCICKHGFRGNGYNCIKISPLLRHQSNEPLNSCMNSCDRETELCISGSCVCKHGYEQRKDGKCVDVNECLSSPCHHLATCTNLLGSFACTCPDGYAGDGKTCIQHLKIGELGVFCEPDGMTLVLGNETTAFEGRIFVRGQAENPYCAKTFSSLQHASKPYMFKVPFEHCNVRLEDQDTFATTVIVQKHPMFITTAADAYDLRCTYPVGVREVESNVNVSDLTTSSTLTDNAHGPSCRLTVTNEADESIAAAVVGQALRLRLEVMPNETYSILPRNCFAINIETGDRYSLTDKAGCAIDDQLFPEWTKIRPSLTEAVFRTFKWPDSSMIRFQCDCSACVGNCPEMNCGRRREAAMRRFRFRRVRDIKNGSAIEERPTDFDYDEDEEEKELLKKIIDPKRLAFSSLVRVREDEEEERAQQQVDHWRNGVTMESETIKELVTQEAAVCLRTVLVFGAMAVTCFCVVVLIYISIRRRRCKAITMQESVSTIGL